ncbi:MAG: hypothetical protein IJU91_09255 [Selenomonadaceae bacterium]|nr:hypothetical protein [Selenomonadaceae bacterium]
MPVNAAVVIPIYKERLNELEKISLAQVQKILGKYQVIFVAPEGLKCNYLMAGCRLYYFPPQFFQSVGTYNILMKHPLFYKAFFAYEYILIYQLDAFVFSDMLEYFCSLGYDYIGAAWYPLRKVDFNGKQYKIGGGNGSFSLRNVTKFYNLILNHTNIFSPKSSAPEDNLFALCGILYPDEFKVAPLKTAYKFSVEVLPRRFVNKNGGALPFGCHDWYKADANFYVDTFLKFGYDLKPLREQLQSLSFSLCRQNLTIHACKRLIRRLQRDESVLKYLLKNRYATIRVIRNPVAMRIFARLILENSNLSDEIFFYNEDEQDILIQDLKLERTPHLLITPRDDIDKKLIEELTKRRITYGTRVVTFWHEYLNYCEKKLKNLGK